ncbi:MAG: PQQ-binding-like beta-propeller repeat protein [Candidatus Bathyarchaeota archaeon]
MRNKVLFALACISVLVLNFKVHFGFVRATNTLMQSPLWRYKAGYYVSSVSVSSNGDHVAIGSFDHKVYLFSGNGTQLWSYETGDYVYAVSISSDGQYVAAGGGDNKVYLFSQSGGTPLWSFLTSGRVRSVSITADGEWIVAGSEDKNIYLFQRTINNPLWNYTTSGSLYSVSIAHNGKYVVAGGTDDNVYLFKLDGTLVWNFTAESDVLSVSTSFDGSHIAAVSNNNLHFFNNLTSTPLWTFRGEGRLAFAAMSHDGKYILSGGWESSQTHLFGETSDVPLWSFQFSGTVLSGSISADSNFVAVGSADNCIHFFDRAKGPPAIWNYTTGDDVWSVAFSDGGKNFLAVGSNDWEVYFFGPDTVSPSAVTLSQPALGTITNNTTPTFYWDEGKDSAPSSGISGYYWEIDVSSSFDSSDYRSVWVGNITEYTPETPLEDDTWHWRVRAMDNVGSNGSWSSTWSILIDTMPPSDSLIRINNDAFFTNSTSVTLTVYADEADKMSFSNNNTTWSNWEMYSATKLWKINIGDGIQHVYFKSRDKAGNTASPVYDGIVLDTTPPSTTVPLSPINKSTIDYSEPTLSWSDSSDLNGVAYYILQIDTTSSFDSPNLLTIFDITQTNYTLVATLSDGTWYWRVFAVDLVGNVGNCSKHVLSIQLMPAWLAWLHRWAPAISIPIGVTSLSITIYKLYSRKKSRRKPRKKRRRKTKK